MSNSSYKLIPFLRRNEIASLCKKLAAEISNDYKDSVVNSPADHVNPQLIAICILKGGIFFIADILRDINIPFVVDFVKLSSYGKDMMSSGTITILQDISVDVRGKNIIIFDEIVDSGRTLSFYIERLRSAEPASIKICTLIDKKPCRATGIKVDPDYIGVEAGKEFLVGYGLDHAEQYRNLPEIYQLIEK